MEARTKNALAVMIIGAALIVLFLMLGRNRGRGLRVLTMARGALFLATWLIYIISLSTLRIKL